MFCHDVTIWVMKRVAVCDGGEVSDVSNESEGIIGENDVESAHNAELFGS